MAKKRKKSKAKKSKKAKRAAPARKKTGLKKAKAKRAPAKKAKAKPAAPKPAPAPMAPPPAPTPPAAPLGGLGGVFPGGRPDDTHYAKDKRRPLFKKAAARNAIAAAHGAPYGGDPSARHQPDRSATSFAY